MRGFFGEDADPPADRHGDQVPAVAFACAMAEDWPTMGDVFRVARRP